MRKAVTVKEAAQRLGVSTRTIRRMLVDGRIRSLKRTNSSQVLLIDEDELGQTDDRGRVRL